MNTSAHTTPDTDNPDAVERALASLTRGPYGPDDPDAAAGLWLKALEKTSPAPAGTRHLPVWKRPVPRPWLIAASVLLLLGVCASVFVPPEMHRASAVASAGTEEKAMKGNWLSSDGDGVVGFGRGGPGLSDDYERARIAQGGGGESAFKSDGWELSTGGGNDGAPAVRRYFKTAPPPPPVTSAPGAPGDPASATQADRFVIRKVSLDVAVTDVRSAFAKAGLVINEAVGEYIEASSLTGEGQAASATVTLRVTASHLSQALIELRKLGTVVAEQAGGQDVTDTVVDLEARLRNEQRIEKEVLALIDKRPDAPLKDVLEIRTQLEAVRGRIEQLVGQRDRIGRLVSLATILVTIKPADAPKPAEKPVEKKDGSIGAYFQESIAGAWRTSLVALVDTAGFLVRAVVGGAPWWLAIASLTFAAWQAVKRVRAKLAAEPAPAG